MDYFLSWIVAIILALVLYTILRRLVPGVLLQRVTILEYQRGVRFDRGRLAGPQAPGVLWYSPLFTRIDLVDLRPRLFTVGGQEVLSADGVTIKVSLAINYQVADPSAAITNSQSFETTLYTELQLVLRELVGAQPMEKLLSERAAIGREMVERTKAKAEELGLKLLAAEVKDVMFPGDLKNMYAQVAKARQEGLALLEKARGETAALRSLANAARMLDDNPNLLQLRLIQALGESSGHTVVLGLEPRILPVNPNKSSKDVSGK